MRTRMIALLAVGTLAFVACGTDDPQVQPPTEDPATGTATPAEDAGFTVQAVGSDEHGEILADEDGNTLYLFTNDSEGVSACTEGCAENWPPLVTDGDPVAGPGVESDLLSTFERDDGTTQVMANGHPLYLYSQDSAPGDTNGQGVGGVWFLVSPEGEQIEA